ncbi:MAG: hypothetical protein LBV36_08935 [Chromatiales bacterium]|jgi:hypothetical protein|nr:hypothetical protein [Chromatiales bacterium]
MPLISIPSRPKTFTLLASILLAGAGTALAQAPALTEGKGGTITLPATLINADAHAFLRPGGPRVEFVQALDARAQAFAVQGDTLILAGDDGLRLLKLRAGQAPIALARLTLPSAATKILIANNTAWVIGDGRLYAVDISKPKSPRLRSTYKFKGMARDFIIAGETGYLLLGSALHVFDLHNSRNVTAKARYTLDVDVHTLVAAEGTLYLAAGANGLYAIDTTQRAQAINPVQQIFRATGEVLDVAFADDRLYLAGGSDGITVLGCEEAGALRWLGSLRGANIDAISVASGRALAHGDDGELFLLDVENPQAMERTALLWPKTERGALLIDAHGFALDKHQQLIGFDLDAPSPRDSNEGLALGQGVNFGGQRRIFIDEQIAYVADWFSGLHIYDVSDAVQPVLLSSFHSIGSPKGVVVRDHIAYVADDDHGLLILDVTDPREPRELVRLDLPGLAYTPVLDGNLLYLAAHRGGVLIVDVSDPRAPVALAQYIAPGKSWSLRVRDGFAFVADDDNGLLILDVSDVNAVHAISSYQPGGRIEEVILDGNLAYVALYEGAVHILDVSDPLTPRVLAERRTPGNARGLALHGSRLYVADWLAGVQIIDVADPTRPRFLGTRDTDGAAWGLAVQGDTVMVADWWGGIATLDASNPAQPTLLSHYPRRDKVNATAARDNFIFTAQGSGGVQIFEASNPLNPTWVTGIELRSASDALVLGEQLWVLHDDGTHVAEIDISNPFEARWSADFTLGYHGKALRAADSAVLALGEHEYTLINVNDEHANQQQHTIDARASDAASSHGMTLLASDDGRLMTLTENGAPDRVLANIGGVIERVVASDDYVLVQVRDEGLRVFEWNDADDLRESARIPVPRPIDALALDDEEIYFASRLDVQAIDISTPSAWHITNAWHTMSAVNSITAHQGTLYFSGTDSLRALARAPTAAISRDDGGALHINVSPLLAPGSYDIGDARTALAESLAHDVLRVKQLRLNKRPR